MQDRKMAKSKYAIAIGIICILTASFYFFVLPSLLSMVNVLQEKLMNYYVKLIYRLKLVVITVFTMTTIYLLTLLSKTKYWQTILTKCKTLTTVAKSQISTKCKSLMTATKSQISRKWVMIRKRPALTMPASATTSTLVTPVTPADEAATPYPLQKVFLIASEMLSTEVQYVNVLRIIEESFHVRVEMENLFQPDMLRVMFANIRTIYNFHANFLLPKLQERMDSWKEAKNTFLSGISVDDPSPNEKIGDIFVAQAPFFKMYGEYLEHFDNAMNTINKKYQKNKKFAALMDEIHALPSLQKLTLQNHMLAPVQRIPRYKLLLEDYIKRLPENSPDLKDAKVQHI